MTYLAFHFVFIVPVLLALIFLRRMEPRVELPFPAAAIASLAAIALVYTTPWDNYLVATGVWTYGPERVIEPLVIGYVPIEEYLFFILQPIMTGLFLLFFAGRLGITTEDFQPPLQRGRPAVIGCGFWLAVTALAAWMLFSLSEHFTYLGLILVWAGPVLAFQWGFGGGTLWKFRRLVELTVRWPTLYLWLVDLIAIYWNIWYIEPATSTGWKLLGLPVEEAIFFAVTNLMVVQGVVLFFQVFGRRRLAQLRREAPHERMVG
ncbi:MAG: lycopene cyclase domain-containing protein [Verrucomicrobiota bacterium]